MESKIFRFVASLNRKCEEDQSIPIASERGDFNISTRSLKHVNRQTWLTDSVPLIPQKTAIAFSLQRWSQYRVFSGASSYLQPTFCHLIKEKNNG